MKGCEIVVDALLREKVEVLFGYPGGSVMDIFDALYGAPIKFIIVDSVNSIQGRRQQGAKSIDDWLIGDLAQTLQDGPGKRTGHEGTGTGNKVGLEHLAVRDPGRPHRAVEQRARAVVDR